MRHFILSLCLALPFVARADDPEYTLVGYRCDVASGRLAIAFRQIKGDDTGHRAKDGWKMWNLGELVSMKDDDHFGKLRTVVGACMLGKARYTLELGPEPQNMNIQGHCGAADLAAWVTVRRDGKQILPRTELGPTCPERERVTTDVVFDARAAAPAMTTVGYDEFYR